MPLQYANLPVSDRWSPFPLMFASGGYALCLTVIAAMCELHFRQIFHDFKIELPMPTLAILTFSQIIWTYFGWVVLVPVMTAWPLVIVPYVTPPQTPESRRVVARTTRLVVMFVYIFTAIVIAIAVFGPMIALIQSVSGPSKS